VASDSSVRPRGGAPSTNGAALGKLPDAALGIPGLETHPGLQTDSFKELINKFAWVLGSTYRVPYSGKKSPAREYALKIAQAVQRDNGYPRQIGLEN